MILDIQLPFNFIIQKNSSTFLHYQGRGIHTILYEYAYYFRIKTKMEIHSLMNKVQEHLDMLK